MRVIEEDQRNNQEVIVRSHQLVKQDKNFHNLMNRDWADAQAKDPVIRHVIDWIERPRDDRRTLDEYLKGRVPEADRRAYAAWEKQFKVMDKLLYLRVTATGGTETLPVFVIPARKRLATIDGCHRCAGHQGRDRTLSLIKERFWWPGMSKTLLMVTSNCGRCKQFEAKGDLPGMQPIICTEPLELVHIDYVGMEVTIATKEKPVVKNVLVVVDHFTWYVQAFVTRNQTAYTMAKKLYNEYFSVFGFPQRLMSDQGTGFTGKVIRALCSLLGIEKLRTTPYHPQSNGSAEHVHQTLQRMIGKLDPNQRQKWPEHIGSILIAYNATRSLVTGYSPYFLMFGRRPQLPIDLLFLTRRAHELSRTIDEYVRTLYDRLRNSLRLAQESALKEAHRQKRLYERKVGAVELRPGDHVLVHLDAFRGQCRKLKNWWGSDLHMVVRHVADGIPAYLVKNMRTGKIKVLHQMRLLLWLTEYGEPVKCNLAGISDTLPGTIPEKQLSGSGEGVPVQERVMYGTSLAMYRTVIDNRESMSCRLAREVRTGIPRQAATSQQIYGNGEELVDPDCLGSKLGDIPGW